MFSSFNLGLMKLVYRPNKHVLSRLMEFGELPIVDCMSNARFEEGMEDYIVSGNSFGELGVLTGRPYNCTITAGTPCQAYILTHEVMKAAMGRNGDPVNG